MFFLDILADQNIEESKIVSFADDTRLYTPIYLPNLPNSTLQLDLYDMSQTESGVRRRKSYDDLCDLQFVPYEASRLFFKAFTDSAITVFCDNLFHGVITR